MDNDKVIFSFKDESEIRDFEYMRDALVAFNEYGENALCFWEEDGQVNVNADIIAYKFPTSYPEVFKLKPKDIVRLHNYLGNLIRSNRDKYEDVYRTANKLDEVNC